MQAKIIVDDTVLEQAGNFEYLGCSISYITNNDVRTKKVHKFNYICGTIRRILKPTRKETRVKFHKCGPLHTSMWVWELNFNEIQG